MAIRRTPLLPPPYATDRETLELVSRATTIHAVEQYGGVGERYELWAGSTGSILALL